MIVAYLGNFEPSFSTETHVAASIEALGHSVVRLQEGTVRAVDVAGAVRAWKADAFLWTQTRSLAEAGGTLDERSDMLADLDVPTIGFHLDRWWGLDRQKQVFHEPFFGVDHLFTADGGHDAEWAGAQINHHWSPPGVFHEEAYDAAYGPRSRDVIFVGAWQSYGHREWWPVRRATLDAVRRRYRRRFECFPKAGRPAVRGTELNVLYASAKVVVGDSCLAGGATRYWSDRIPETLGRGGFLIHPYVEGIETEYVDGEHLRLYEVGNHRELLKLIDHYLEHDAERETIRAAGAAHVRANYTYRDRLAKVFEVAV